MLSKIILTTLALAIAFSAGACAAIERGWGSPLVQVIVQNRTAGLLTSIRLSHTSCGTTTSLSGGALAAGEERVFRFLVCGEGGYELEAALPGGAVLKSGNYVERGYRVVDKVEASRIFSETSFFPL